MLEVVSKSNDALMDTVSILQLWKENSKYIQRKMTLKGRKNHYKVKLLRGYVVSISLKNNKVVLRNGRDVLSSKLDFEEWFVTKLPYEK